MSGRIRARLSALTLVLATAAVGCSGFTSSAPSSSAGATGSATASARPSTPPAFPSAVVTTCTPAAPGGDLHSMARCRVAAPSLAGNLLGDPAAVSAYVLTPTGYATSGLRYPVVYVLAGFGDSGFYLADNISIAGAPAGDSTPPIIVVASGANGLGGGFYVNSSVGGNWEDAITVDLVGFIDAAYPTIARRTSRGIAGHSMGGFGAINIGMRHPELFSAVFAESPGLFDPSGSTARLGDPQVVDSLLTLQAQLRGKSTGEIATALKAAAASAGGAASNVADDRQFELAYGVAFAPDPTSSILMELPVHLVGDTVVRDDAVWAKWEAGFGDLASKVDRYRSNLAQLSGIALDWGTRDEFAWIPTGCQYFASLLERAGLKVTATSFDGTHTDQLAYRTRNYMLPFMEGLLATS